MKKIRILTLVLALLMTVSVFVSCANDKNDDTAETTTAALVDVETTEAETTVDNTPKLTVPEDLNFGGKDLTIFTWSNQTMWEWDSKEYTGDLIQDAIYDRTLKTEERLGIKIVIESTPGEWENRNTFIQKVGNSVLSGTGAYDIVGQYTPAASLGAMNKLYLNLREIEYLNIDQPWWPGDIVEASAINGKLYFMTGDITPTLIRNMSCVMVNENMAEQYDIGSIFALVDSGKWTLEKVKEIAVGKVGVNEADPYYGLCVNNNVMYDAFFYGGGFKFVENKADGTLAVSDSVAGEKMVNWFSACQSLLFDNPDVELLAIDQAFTNQHSIMQFGQTSDIQNYLKDVTFDFAIAPFPKYDVDQENYYTVDGYWVSMYSIPIDVKDESMAGAALEVLCYEGANLITPAVYEDSFQYKYLATEDNARMFDLLHDTLTWDIGRIFADQFNCFAAFRDAAKSATSEWSSYFKASKKIWQKNAEKVFSTLG